MAITSSFHPDEHTHVENCRYGKGSNAVGLVATLLVPGGSLPRPVMFLREVVRHPLVFLRSLSQRRWSERTIIGLVMQTRDNSLQVTGARGGSAAGPSPRARAMASPTRPTSPLGTRR